MRSGQSSKWSSLIYPTLFCAQLVCSVFAESHQPDYSISTIEMGDVKDQVVLSAFLNSPKNASLVIATVDNQNVRKISIFEMENGIYPQQANVEHVLEDDVILMDVGHFGNREVLVMFGRNEAWIYNPLTKKRQKLVDISTIYGSPMIGALPKMDLFRDLNDDGLDDFIIPGFDGFQIFIQRGDGSFDGPMDVHAPPLVEMSYNDYPLYQPKNTFLADMTLNGKQDLTFWVNGKFSVYRQGVDGLFDPRPLRITSQVDFQFDGIEGLSSAVQEEDQSDNIAKAIYQITDLDGDDVPDLVTYSMKSEGVFKKTTTYEIHKGLPRKGMVQFSATSDSTIESAGIQFEMVERDFNNDGQTDMVISTVELGIGKILAALITGSIKTDLNFYQMIGGRYPKKPILKREITATFSLSSGDVFFPSVLIADVDGDRIDDLLVQEGFDKLKIFMGRKDGKLFSKRAINIEVAMPNEPDLVELADLNADGRRDLVMRHQAVGKPRKVVVMVSR